MGMGGSQRSSKFVKYLPAYDWEPIVLTVKDVRYYALDDFLLDDIKNRTVIRTESFDPLRLLNRLGSGRTKNKTENNVSKGHSKILNFINQSIFSWLCLPDSKILWLPFLLISAFKTFRKHDIGVVYTTSPPHSAHLAGVILKLFKKVTFVADFRDDWAGGESQPSPTIVHDFFNRLLEKIVLKTADIVISMCDPLTKNLFKKSGRWSDQNKFITVTNGYDCEDFLSVLNQPTSLKFTITHGGSISKVSDPDPFLQAVSMLFDEKPDLKEEIQVQFFGTDLFGRFDYLINKYNLQKYISPVSYLSHPEVLKKIMQSHVLLLTINRTTQEEIITSKVFEYLASGKSILLISEKGEVARMVKNLNRGTVIDPEDIIGIKDAIFDFYQKYKNRRLNFAEPLSIKQYDRKLLTGKLAEIFSQVKKVSSQ